MSSHLPLADNLFQKVTQRTRPVDVLLLQSQFDRLSSDQKNHITLLLIHYYYYSGGTEDIFRSQKKSDLPYDIRMNSTGKGFSFDLGLLSPLLLNTLAEYMSI